MFEEVLEFFECALAHIAQVDVALSGDHGKRPAVDHHVQFRSSTSPRPRFLLMYWETAARVTPSLLAASLWLRPCFWTSRTTISARMGGSRFRTMVSQCIRVQVCFVMRRPAAARGLGSPELVDDLACIAEVELLDDELAFLEFLQRIADGPRREVALLDDVLVGHRATGIQYLQHRL